MAKIRLSQIKSSAFKILSYAGPSIISVDFHPIRPVGVWVVGWVVVGVQSGGRVVGGVIRLSFVSYSNSQKWWGGWGLVGWVVVGRVGMVGWVGVIGWVVVGWLGVVSGVIRLSF